VYWIDQETGVLCRIRPDWWVPERGFIMDVKTTEDASPEGFRKSIANYNYEMQDAYYTDGIHAATGQPLRAFFFLAVEKGARGVDGQPLGVGLYLLDQASRDLGRLQYRNALHTYAECATTGNWPGYGLDVMNIALPAWSFTRNAQLLEQAAA
jgi:exodeoxyribonuclease VIII